MPWYAVSYRSPERQEVRRGGWMFCPGGAAVLEAATYEDTLYTNRPCHCQQMIAIDRIHAPLRVRTAYLLLRGGMRSCPGRDRGTRPPAWLARQSAQAGFANR